MQHALISAAPALGVSSRVIASHQYVPSVVWRPAPRSVDRMDLPKTTRKHDIAVRASPPSVRPEAEVDRMTSFLDSLKWDSNGLVVAIAQHVDTGEVLMQAFADRNAINETLQTG